MPPEAILFDFDGTLVDTEWQIYLAWKHFYAREGQELPIEVYVQCIGSDFDTWSPKTHLENLTGRAFDWEALDLSRNKEIRASLAGQGAVEGVRELLDKLSGKVPMAVVSSSSHDWVDGWLERLDLTSYFDATICQGDAPRIKPAPDLYLQAAKVVGLSPEKCLVIEDSVNGCLSAKAADMQAYALPNRITRVSDFSLADRVFQTMPSLSIALCEIFG